jgi:hypothetical protein
MPIPHRHIGSFFAQSKRHLKKLLPDALVNNPYLAWSLFGTTALAPILGYEAEQLRRDRLNPEPEPEDDEPDITRARASVSKALGKTADLTSVLATELAEQTVLRGLNDMRESVRHAKRRGTPGLPKLPKKPADSLRNASRNDASDEDESDA